MQTNCGISIQEMARRSGLSEHTLRYYERIGLIAPIPRDLSSRHRRYPLESLPLMEILTCLRGTGMPLTEIRRFLDLRQSGVLAAAEIKALFLAHAAEVARELETAQVRLAYLQGKAAFWDAVEAGDKAKAQQMTAVNQETARVLVGMTKHAKR